MMLSLRRLLFFVVASIFTCILLSLPVVPAQKDDGNNNGKDDDDDDDDGTSGLPPLLDSDDIAYFFENGDTDRLFWALSNVFARSARNPDAEQIVHGQLPEQLVSRGGGSVYTTAYKMKHDLEQAEYLAENLEDQKLAHFFASVVAPTYRRVLERIPSLDKLQRTSGLYPFQKPDLEAEIQAIYNKALHQTAHSVGELKDEKGNLLPLINPNLNVELIESQWLGNEKILLGDTPHPGIIVIDNVLSAEALASIQKIMWESTVWYQTKLPLKFGGYVGAYIDDGLNDEILLRLSVELHGKLPRIFENHPLKYLWAYKYDSEYTGINLHADQAAVNVNIWLTPDEANLDPASGGLVVFTAKPPPEWNFAQYNTDTAFVRERLLRPTGFANVTIPYKTNRAVIFDSALFHQTDHFKFKEGYKNRRINLTLLYGDMQLSSSIVKDEL